MLMQAMIKTGDSLPFSTTRDRQAMQEWVSVKAGQDRWPALAQEALDFTASQDGPATATRPRRKR